MTTLNFGKGDKLFHQALFMFALTLALLNMHLMQGIESELAERIRSRLVGY